MLRASAEATDTPVNLMAIADLSLEPLIEGGSQLLAFTTALVGRDPQALTLSRTDLTSKLGPAATAAAAGAAGNFQMMNRLLDATGVPKPMDRSIELELGLSRSWVS